jgi:hypothetical protein
LFQKSEIDEDRDTFPPSSAAFFSFLQIHGKNAQKASFSIRFTFFFFFKWKRCSSLFVLVGTVTAVQGFSFVVGTRTVDKAFELFEKGIQYQKVQEAVARVAQFLNLHTTDIVRNFSEFAEPGTIFA